MIRRLDSVRAAEESTDTMVYSSYNDLIRSNFDALSKEQELTEELTRKVELLNEQLMAQMVKTEELSTKLSAEEKIKEFLDEHNKELSEENAKNDKLLQTVKRNHDIKNMEAAKLQQQLEMATNNAIQQKEQINSLQQKQKAQFKTYELECQKVQMANQELLLNSGDVTSFQCRDCAKHDLSS